MRRIDHRPGYLTVRIRGKRPKCTRTYADVRDVPPLRGRRCQRNKEIL